MKTGRLNPGILVVDKCYTFQCNKTNKTSPTYNYVCSEWLTVGVKCKAKAVVTKCEVPGLGEKYVLSKVDNNHSCTINYGKAIADEMRYEIKSIVRGDPQRPVTEAIKQVRRLYSERYDDDDVLFDQIMAELGPDKPLIRQLLRVRNEVIGKSPKNRNEFDPEAFLSKIFGDDHNIITLDSNKLEPGWRSLIDKKNPNSTFNWEKVDDVRHHEEEDDDVDDSDAESEDGCVEKDLPKRILGYTSAKMVKMLGKKLKASVDGTFKSACRLWRQNFCIMVKYCGHWIPIVHSWLPDKSEESYKVNIYL